MLRVFGVLKNNFTELEARVHIFFAKSALAMVM